MKYKKSETHTKVYSFPQFKFEDQQISSFSGLVLFQALFQKLELKKHFTHCFGHLSHKVFGPSVIFMVMVVHILLGYRRFKDVQYYHDDPLVKRVLGLSRLPDDSTISRNLGAMDDRCYEASRDLNWKLHLDRVKASGLKRVTLDFDGSVRGTDRKAEGTAVGVNKKKKGQPSYYDLFCTNAQTGQVVDVLQRSGNVHDSNGSLEFIIDCSERYRALDRKLLIESRFDSAFFSESHVEVLDGIGIKFTISVPFHRFPQLKTIIENRKWWSHYDDKWSFFNLKWSPKIWDRNFRFIVLRQKVKVREKGPKQLDLAVPHKEGYDFTVIVTNKTEHAKQVMRFHHGRGSQETIFAEMKTDGALGYIPSRKRITNRMYLMAGIFAHNLNRELQMQAMEQERGTREKRPALWVFEKMGTFRRKIVQRAGRLTKPQNKLTLVMSPNPKVKEKFVGFLKTFRIPA